MKKPLLLFALSITAVGLATGPASAGLLERLCGGGCTVHIKYRPYNAFDPGCCYGSVCGNLSGLFGGMGGGPCWAPPPCMPPYENGPCGNSCMNSGCCDFGSLPATDPDPMPAITPGAPAAPAPGGPAFTPPMPTPLPATSQMYYYPVPVAQNQVHAAGYYPNYYPGYYPSYPAAYYPPAQGYPAPYYPYGMPTYGQNYGR